MLGADGQADGVLVDAHILQLLGGQLGVGGGGRVDDQALHVSDVGQQREDLQVVDELKGFLLAALDVEGKDGSTAVGEVLPRRCEGRDGPGRLMIDVSTFRVMVQNPRPLDVRAGRSRRRDRVSVPCSSSQALNGLMQAPVSRRMMART